MAPENAAVEAANLTPRRESTGLFSRLPNPLNLFRSPSKAAQEEVPDEQQEDEDTTVRQPRGSIPSEEEEEEIEIIEQRGFTPSDGEVAILQREQELVQGDSESEQGSRVPIQPPKRKRVEPRDEYAVPVEDLQGEDPVVISRKLKRARTTKPTAKKPLVQPKSTKGPVPRKVRIGRANGETSTALEASDSAPTSDTIVTNEHTSEGEAPRDQPTTSKRGRGRPKKNPDPPPIPAEEPAEVLSAAEDAEDDTDKGKEPAAPILDTYEGETSLFMNPSPIKPPHPPVQAAKSMKAKAKEIPAVTHVSGQLPELTDDSEEEERPGRDGPEFRRTAERDEPEVENAEQVSDGDHETPLIDLKALRSMWQAAKRVGYKQVGNSWEKQHTVEKLYSDPGKRIDRKVKNLTTQYKALLEASVAQDMTSLQEAQGNIDFVLPPLERDIQNMISKRLKCAETEKKNMESLLTDLYFKLVPDMLETIVAFAKAKAGQEKIRTEDLQEFQRLVQILYDVAAEGIKQKSDDQPKAPNKSKTYHIKKPTKNDVIPGLRIILKKVRKELDTRERISAKSEYDRLKPERERRRQEEQVRNDLEHARRCKEIHSLQREAWKAKLSEPFWGDMLSFSMEKVGSDRSVPRSRSQTTYRRHEDGDGEEENEYDDDPFADLDEQSIERVSVFGKNNNKNSDHFKELSLEEREIFVKEMMTSIDDKDKYQRAAEALDRNIDEIFVFAQELQDHMHRMHEEGFYRESEDQWTHYIVQ